MGAITSSLTVDDGQDALAAGDVQAANDSMRAVLDIVSSH